MGVGNTQSSHQEFNRLLIDLNGACDKKPDNSLIKPQLRIVDRN